MNWYHQLFEPVFIEGASPVALWSIICLQSRRQSLKSRRAWSLGREDPLEEGMATYSRILAWRIPWTEQPDGLQSVWSQRVGREWSDWAHTNIVVNIKEGGKEITGRQAGRKVKMDVVWMKKTLTFIRKKKKDVVGVISICQSWIGKWHLASGQH